MGESGPDTRRALAEQLVSDIPENACVMVFNQTFEKSRIAELAEIFPDLSDKLLKIKDNIKDLLIPFHKGYYYNKAMKGSYSIKYVLPALYPDDESLDYSNLSLIHKGDEASNAFLSLKDKTPVEREKIRNALLKYCELDTYAMVKIWEKFIEVTE